MLYGMGNEVYCEARNQIDLGYIKQAYQRIYGRDLLHDVRDDTSGYYRDILTGIISRV